MKVRVKVRPSGLLNGEPWPEKGETLDLPDQVAEAMIAAGDVEKADKPAKKTVEKKVDEKVEKRPAPQKAVETREKTKD